MESGAIHKGRIDACNSGGLLVRFGSLQGFLPFSQMTVARLPKGVISFPVLFSDQVIDSVWQLFGSMDEYWSCPNCWIQECDYFWCYFSTQLVMWGSVFCKKSLLDLSGQCQSSLTCFLGFGKGSMCQAFMLASFWPSLHSAIFAVLVVL